MQRHELKTKYGHYKDQEHFILGVTLSTYIKSDWYARSDRTRHFWDQHFIRRVLRRVPVNALDHDYVMEKSPQGFWHYHGLLAVTARYGERLWKQGALHQGLWKDINGFKRRGDYRPFRVNSFRVEPLNNFDAWCTYITKQQRD